VGGAVLEKMWRGSEGNAGEGGPVELPTRPRPARAHLADRPNLPRTASIAAAGPVPAVATRQEAPPRYRLSAAWGV